MLRQRGSDKSQETTHNAEFSLPHLKYATSICISVYSARAWRVNQAEMGNHTRAAKTWGAKNSDKKENNYWKKKKKAGWTGQTIRPKNLCTHYGVVDIGISATRQDSNFSNVRKNKGIPDVFSCPQTLGAQLQWEGKPVWSTMTPSAQDYLLQTCYIIGLCLYNTLSDDTCAFLIYLSGFTNSSASLLQADGVNVKEHTSLSLI